jgi:glycosyltransferase involved in cell wall biosynthesis
MSRVWIVSDVFDPKLDSTGLLMTRLARGLAGWGEVNVLCARYRSADGQLATLREHTDGVNVRRCRTTRFNKDNPLLRLVNVVTSSLTLFFGAVGSFRSADRVMVVTSPPLLPFLVSIACSLRSAKCTLLIHDVYPDVFAAVGWMRKESMLYRILSHANRWLYRRVDSIVALGRDMAALAAAKLATSPNKITVIPNWADVAEIAPAGASHLRARLGLEGKFIVLYSGNLGRTHGIDTIVSAARLLRDDATVHFVIIGAGAGWREVQAAAARGGPGNIMLLPLVPREELADSLACGDVSLIAFKPGMAGVSVPSRMYSVMASGRPILAVADPGSELAQVVIEERIGWVIPPGDAEALAAAVRLARESRVKLGELGMRARQVAESKYEFARALRTYARVLGLEDHAGN